MKEFTITLTESEMNIIEKSMRIAMSNTTTLPHKMTEEEKETQIKQMTLWKKLMDEINK